MQIRPILLNSCARAATAAEARFRIDAPIKPSRATRVVALDDSAAAVIREVAAQPWASARFFSCDLDQPPSDGDARSADAVRLRTIDGTRTQLADELADVDVAVMVATSDDGAEAAAVIGAACTVRGIMTAGLVVGEGREAGDAAGALRPHARFLLVSADEHDVVEVLTALRA